MSETAEKVEEATAEKAKKGQRPVEKVTMSDGRVVSFLGAQGDKKAQRFSKDALDARVQAGDWTKTRVGGDLAGKSILVKALMAYTGRSAQEMQEHIKGWDKNARDQLSADPDIKVHIDRIRQEMADRGPKVDVAGLKAGLKKLAA